ncbi:tRNA uridine-5-carboxymethylaminomethyl(34) synthesis GTPase MnmE [Sphingomonas sp. URHD0057]|uniref:tRNA uridine-5-carboxymethylaminomethyl(34) synthesis GTPase MnmE n=1 Tax=Sphingomonas sp. URHD0057 TaxID=1380389 RepID=UPI00049178B8|nr:tRNA uridine-5-carboxymethylaminomethyl(34) synthesis GTPase MnmE [Sphingomonas sp. URHD0057]
MDTIFALSSGRPPAAIAVIRISGAVAHEAARRMAGLLPDARHAALRELRDPATCERLDEALVLRFDAPASSTGEDSVEFHCHGGRAVVDAVLRTLGQLDGLREAEPGEFTRRAFENGRIDLTEAEGLADLIEAETESQRKAALALAEGGLRRQLTEWQDRLLDLSAAAERAIDYDEDDSAIDPSLLTGVAALVAELDQWLARPRIEPLKDGVRVVVAGPPNAGKSSLVNAVAGVERAIVTDVPGTTRDHIEVPLAIAGLPILLTDTAGLRTTEDQVEAIGVERANQLAAAADILLWLGEPNAAPPGAILVHARADMRGPAPEGSLAVSAKTGVGLTELLDRVAQAAKPLLPGEGAIALNRRQAKLLAEARDALATPTREAVLVAENLRLARGAFDRLTGRAGVEDVLDTLFSRFCLGK